MTVVSKVGHWAAMMVGDWVGLKVENLGDCWVANLVALLAVHWDAPMADSTVAWRAAQMADDWAGCLAARWVACWVAPRVVWKAALTVECSVAQMA